MRVLCQLRDVGTGKELTGLEKRFYTVKEFAGLTGKHRNTIKNYLHGGLVRYVKIQNAILIPVDELARLEASAVFGGTTLAQVAAPVVAQAEA